MRLVLQLFFEGLLLCLALILLFLAPTALPGVLWFLLG